MQDAILVVEPCVVYADVEDGYVFLIHSTLVSDTDELLNKVWALVGASAPTEDRTEDNDYYLFRKARIRRWKL